MKQSVFEIKSNTALTDSVSKMVLVGDTSAVVRPGQFVNIQLDGLFLRRPISVCDVNGDELTIIYKAVGVGTEHMRNMAAGEKLDVLTGLGNGYDVTASGKRPLVMGGGVGVPPLYMLTKQLIANGAEPLVLLGFNSASDVILVDELRALGAEVRVATVDGSCGKKGFVTNLIENDDYTYVYSCGPEPMLKAVYNATGTSGELSFEERMGCGFGACMGCTCETKYGAKRICKDGPVLKKEEVVW